jgi:hypothetical protein
VVGKSQEQLKLKTKGVKLNTWLPLNDGNKEQIKNQGGVADLKAGYKSLRPEAVKVYCNLVFQSSDLPNGLGS